MWMLVLKLLLLMRWFVHV